MDFSEAALQERFSEVCARAVPPVEGWCHSMFLTPSIVGARTPVGGMYVPVLVSQFGHVLTAVIRIREPDAEHLHNSWALVAFGDPESVERLLGSQTAAHVEGDRMTFTARRINPKLAVSSDGSFGQIFRTCNDRVAQARAVALACADSKLTYHLRDRYHRPLVHSCHPQHRSQWFHI